MTARNLLKGDMWRQVQDIHMLSVKLKVRQLKYFPVGGISKVNMGSCWCLCSVSQYMYNVQCETTGSNLATFESKIKIGPNLTISPNLLKMPKFDQKWKSKFLKGLFSVVVIARSSLTTSTTPLLPNDFHFNQCHHPALFGGHKVFVNATQLVGAIWYKCSWSKFVTESFQRFCGFINDKEAH